MTYIVNNYDGSPLFEIPDGTLNQTLDITLIGKNYPNYGQPFAESMVRLLQNFARNSAPSKPVKGQIWYDTLNKRVSVYSGAEWSPIGSATVGTTAPTSGVGSLWFNSSTKQFYVFDGTTNNLIGPDVAAGFATTKFQSETLVDTNNISHAVIIGYIDSEKTIIITNARFDVSGVAGFSQLYRGINLKSDFKIIGDVIGNASTATALQFPRRINGVLFDGSSDIELTAASSGALNNGSYLTGSNYDGNTATTWAVDASTAALAGKVVARDTNANFSANMIYSKLTGNVFGNVSGDLIGNSYGIHYGDVKTSTPSRSLLVDAANSIFYGGFRGTLTGDIKSQQNTVSYDSNNNRFIGKIRGNVESTNTSEIVLNTANPVATFKGNAILPKGVSSTLESDVKVELIDNKVYIHELAGSKLRGLYRDLSKSGRNGENGPFGIDAFESGTTLPFYQSSAPSGWTQITDSSADDKMMRVVKDGTGGQGAGIHSPTVMDWVPIHTHVASSADSGTHTHNLSPSTTTVVGGVHNHSGKTGGPDDTSHVHYYSDNTGAVNIGTDGSIPDYAHANPNRQVGYANDTVWINGYFDRYTDTPLENINNKLMSHTHTISNDGSHTHLVIGGTLDGGSHIHTITVNNNSATTTPNGNAGNWQPKYANFIIARKD